MKVNDIIVIPLKAEDHIKKTGHKCKIAKILDTTVYVAKWLEKKNRFAEQKSWNMIDKSFLQKYIESGEYK